MNPALQQRPRFLAPGDKLGKYDLIRQIAIGGMAELYLARGVGIEGFEKLVVLKRILPQYMDNQQFVNMFLNEARLAAQLQHPNVAQVYDIGVEQGDYFFSMEYIHGEDLGRLNASALENGCPMSLDASLTLVAGLCAGLHYAHDKCGPDGTPLGVVHRDVSPSNVLVSYDGAVKLVDFGIARASSHGSTQGGLKGKIAYMSPEQCRGKVVLDRRSDIFSVGSILYELTTGQLPFTDETEYGILNQIVNADARPPSQLVAGYPPALEAIVMRALARDPDQRYRSALELQGHVEDFAHDNRLRVSPLVLARLMSTLFPARLEEWEHARKQGAFFVEQHVVQTLIEGGKSTDDAPAYVAKTDAEVAVDNEPTNLDVLTASLGDQTRTEIRNPTPPPLPAVAAPPAARMLATTPVAGAPLATPVPGHLGFPNGVPIIQAFSTPVPGTLVGHGGGVVHEGGKPGELTLRINVGAAVPGMRRSRMRVVAVAAIAAVAVGAVIFVIASNGDKAASVSPIASPVAPSAARAVVTEKPADSERKPVVMAPVIDAPVANTVDEPADAIETPVAVSSPATKPKVDKRPRPVAKRDKKITKPAPKPTKKDDTWNADSPFLPVRPDKR